MDRKALKKNGADPKKEEQEEGFQPELMIGLICPTHAATSYCKQSITFSVASINNIENDRS
jgi:hypothetical protein